MGARDHDGPPSGGADGGAAGFREIDYSGDIGVEAWGSTRAELLANATRGLFGLLSWSPAGGDVTRPVEVAAGAAADVLVDWLSAVILSAAMHGEVYGEVAVESADERGARGWVRGAAYDPARHALRFDVKAATYHDLAFESTDGGFRARVIFDL